VLGHTQVWPKDKSAQAEALKVSSVVFKSYLVEKTFELGF
jgi:hypothetical protein